MSRGGSQPGYRPDIDGLRALAVLPVVLFHAGVPGFSGGFIGVDIFFVISGYLITGIIAGEMAEGRFSVWRFYERRARRILPALFVVVAVVLAAASLLFLPGDFENVPPSALAALLFVANVWFYTQTGYFATSAEDMPLLHTWSLGVEEQFYIVFPLGLMLLSFARRSWRMPLLWLAALGSFALCLWPVAEESAFAFYMLPARAWELLAGALLALGAVPAVRQRWLREGLALAAVAAIALAVMSYDADTSFPGPGAAVPVLGTALLIHLAPGTAVGRVLSWRPMVGIGLLSYSLYLWHWPLIVFVSYWTDSALTPWQSLAVVAGSLLLARASLEWVERPWRDTARFPRKSIWTMSATGIAMLAAASALLMSLGPWTARFPAEAGRMAAARADVSPLRAPCLTTAFTGFDPRCTIGPPGRADAMLWGDSHGAEFAWVLGQHASQTGRALVQRTLASCAPVTKVAQPEWPSCVRFNQAVLAELERRPELRTVYLAALWAGDDYRGAITARRLDGLIGQLQAMGRRVVLIGAVPRQPRSVPRALARAAAFDLPPPRTANRDAYDRDTAWMTRHYARWRAAGVRIVDPAQTLFTGEKSRIIADGHPLYFDSHHLTLAGARMVLDKAGEI